MGMPQVLWNYDVQAPADHFVRRITKQIGCGIVPDLNHSLSVRKDDGIRPLVNNEPENLKVVVAR
jgi:hypothetical protein